MKTALDPTAPGRPVIELLARYRAIFGAAWAARRELAGPKLMADEAAFRKASGDRVFARPGPEGGE